MCYFILSQRQKQVHLKKKDSGTILKMHVSKQNIARLSDDRSLGESYSINYAVYKVKLQMLRQNLMLKTIFTWIKDSIIC